MEENQCDKCNKKFANKSTYNLHIKTSKCSNIKDNNNFICSFCNKKYSSNQMLAYHNTICIEKKIHDIKTEYENQISDIHESYRKILIINDTDQKNILFIKEEAKQTNINEGHKHIKGLCEKCNSEI